MNPPSELEIYEAALRPKKSSAPWVVVSLGVVLLAAWACWLIAEHGKAQAFFQYRAAVARMCIEQELMHWKEDECTPPELSFRVIPWKPTVPPPDPVPDPDPVLPLEPKKPKKEIEL